MRTSVIVATLNRPDCVQRCLECLAAQALLPDQVIVVDASPDERTRLVVNEFDDVIYVRNENGVGNTTLSRNMGLLRATGEIIVFLDDDAYAHPEWLAEIVSAYEPDVGAVGGRALRQQSGEEIEGVGDIGRLTSDGLLTGFFAADPGHTIEVDHLLGANMSFRGDVLARIGGLREGFPGTCLREETDICLRVSRLGFRVLFNPRAIVDHAGAPQFRGERFDLRYDYYAQRNHLVFLLRNFGLTDPILRRYLAVAGRTLTRSLIERVRAGRIAAAAARLAAGVAGLVTGFAAGLALLARSGRDPIRRDAEGQAIAAALQRGLDNEATGG